MIVRNLDFGKGLVVNGQKVVLRGISPNSTVVQVELLIPEKQTYRSYPPHCIYCTSRASRDILTTAFNFRLGSPTRLLSTNRKGKLLAV